MTPTQTMHVFKGDNASNLPATFVSTLIPRNGLWNDSYTYGLLIKNCICNHLSNRCALFVGSLSKIGHSREHGHSLCGSAAWFEVSKFSGSMAG